MCARAFSTKGNMKQHQLTHRERDAALCLQPQPQSPSTPLQPQTQQQTPPPRQACAPALSGHSPSALLGPGAGMSSSGQSPVVAHQQQAHFTHQQLLGGRNASVCGTSH